MEILYYCRRDFTNNKQSVAEGDHEVSLGHLLDHYCRLFVPANEPKQEIRDKFLSHYERECHGELSAFPLRLRPLRLPLQPPLQQAHKNISFSRTSTYGRIDLLFYFSL